MPFDQTGYVETQNTTLGLLLRSRERLKAGWIKGHLSNASGYCAIGTMRADGNKAMRADATAYLYRALPFWHRFHLNFWNNLNHAEACVAHYNDGSKRSLREILRLYDRAIALCRADDPQPPDME